VARRKGGVISPLLANLYLHYAFDLWMIREFPDIPFERYADDVICHCGSEHQAMHLKDAIAQRFATCQLELHPQKTKVVYCKAWNRTGKYPIVRFDFLGYSFQPRLVKSKKGTFFVGFNPAISSRAATAIRRTMRSWGLHRKSDLSLEQIARRVNPVLRGWITYYGVYFRSVLHRVLSHLDMYLSRWAMMKYKSLRQRQRHAGRWVRNIALRQPTLFAHWEAFQRVAGL
jgi:RNA-directed DNA polymerase